jgi:DNA-binding HxlR family transcriptional regulator
MEVLPDISTKVLTQQLVELEADNIITRQSFKESPPRVAYSLTDYGKTLFPVLKLIKSWGLNHLKKNPKILHRDSEWKTRV